MTISPQSMPFSTVIVVIIDKQHRYIVVVSILLLAHVYSKLVLRMRNTHVEQTQLQTIAFIK